MRPAQGENEKMRRQILDSRRRVVQAVIGAFPGGRECAAALLGMDLKQFDNKAYENPGHRPLTDEQVRQLELVAGTSFLPDYISSLYSGVHAFLPAPAKLDNVELYHLAMDADVKEGQLSQTIAEAIGKDGIDSQELASILHLHRQHVAALHTEVLAVIALHRKQQA